MGPGCRGFRFAPGDVCHFAAPLGGDEEGEVVVGCEGPGVDEVVGGGDDAAALGVGAKVAAGEPGPTWAQLWRGQP